MSSRNLTPAGLSDLPHSAFWWCEFSRAYRQALYLWVFMTCLAFFCVIPGASGVKSKFPSLPFMTPVVLLVFSLSLALPQWYPTSFLRPFSPCSPLPGLPFAFLSVSNMCTSCKPIRKTTLTLPGLSASLFSGLRSSAYVPLYTVVMLHRIMSSNSGFQFISRFQGWAHISS